MQNTERDLKMLNVAKDAFGGRTRSKTAMSLENLVNILPIGFESKNRILDLLIFSIILLCIFVVLVTRIINITNDLENVRMI